MNQFSYYIFDVDGITLVTFGEEATHWAQCNLEGEPCQQNYIGIIEYSGNTNLREHTT